MLDRYFYTFHNPAGNRALRGSGRFPDVLTVDVPLRGVPAWAVGYAMETAVWHVVLRDGTLQVIEVAPDGAARSLAYAPGWFAGGQPPLVGVSMVEGTYVMRSDESVSPQSHPIPVNDFEVLYINRAGDLVLSREEGIVAQLPAAAAPAARLVMNRAGQVALYARSGLGERQASALLVLQARDSAIRLLSRRDLPGADVYAGNAPFWADIDGDGNEDLVTTVTGGALGARLRAYLWDGGAIRQEVDGPAGQRRQQLAAAAFAADGAVEVAALSAAAGGGQMEFFRYQAGGLRRLAALPGLTAQARGDRNFDRTAAGDFDGDGMPEALAMDDTRQRIVAVRRCPAGAEVAWRLNAEAEIVSNFAPVELLEAGLGLAVGTADARLRVWLPRQ